MGNTICYFFSYLIEAVILWQFSSMLFPPRHTRPVRILTLCGIYLLLFLASFPGLKWLNMTLYLLANWGYLHTQYRLKWHSALFYSAILASVMGMCELSVYSVFQHFAPHFFEQVSDFHNTVLFGIFSKLTFFTIVYVLIHLLRKRNPSAEDSDRSGLFLICVPLASVLVMLAFVGISDTYTLTPALNRLVTVSAVFLLTANLLVFGINQYSRMKSMELTEMQLLLQREADTTEYYHLLRDQNENQRILIHDIRKHLQMIDALNAQKENERSSEYIRELMESPALKGVARMCDNPTLNALLVLFKDKCAAADIAYHVDIRCGSTDFISDADLTSLFFNLLENALEAAAGMPDAHLDLSSDHRNDKSFTVIKLVNSCRADPLPGDGDVIPSSKSDRRLHGFGLKSIRRVVRKYNGDLKMYYTAEDTTFHTIIVLKHPAAPGQQG